VEEGIKALKRRWTIQDEETVKVGGAEWGVSCVRLL
jgi:hypothetical protein